MLQLYAATDITPIIRLPFVNHKKTINNEKFNYQTYNGDSCTLNGVLP